MDRNLRTIAELLALLLVLVEQTLCAQMIIPTVAPDKAKFHLPPNYEKGKYADPVLDWFVESLETAINPIKASDMDFRMEVMLVQRWRDLRLNFSEDLFGKSDRIILPLEFVDLMWHPDPFISNAKSTDVGHLTQKLINVNIYRNHSISYSINLFATVACSMQFQYYPFDFQSCPTVIESFSYDESQVKYVWAEQGAFTINPKLRLLQFVVTYPLRVQECSIHRIKEERNYSQLIAYFRFDRLLGNHLIQTFSPCCLVVSLSWFSFWLELDAISARVSLLVTSMLTLVTQFAGLKADFPPVAYVKAVDLWMAMCMIFVFAALGEFVIVKVIYSLTEDAKVLSSLELSEDRSQSVKTIRTLVSPGGLSPKGPSLSRHKLGSERNSLEYNASQNSCTADSNTKVYQPKKLGSGGKKKVFRRKSSEFPDCTYHLLGRVGIPLIWTNYKTARKHILWRDIDYMSRGLFPLTFCLSLSIYWIILFIHSRLNSPNHPPPSYCS